MTTSYPPPPWQTFGDGAAASYLVKEKEVVLPAGLRPVSLFRRCMGVLAYVEYKPPSPLVYNELIWMPTLVKAGGRTRLAHYVAKMYVDNEASLAAGRALWALPKTLATFRRDGDRVRVEAEDGTRCTVHIGGALGPRRPMTSKVSTIQSRSGDLEGFRCSFMGDVQLGRVAMEDFQSDDPGWRSFHGARRLPASSGRLIGFEATMEPSRPMVSGS